MKLKRGWALIEKHTGVVTVVTFLRYIEHEFASGDLHHVSTRFDNI